MTDRLCTPEEANAFHPPPRKRFGALVWASVCIVSICSAAFIALR